MAILRRNFLIERARELAVAAGLDPDSRVDRLGEAKGGRGWPAWCDFHEAAVNEQIRACAAARGLPPQAATYQNAPLTVFGTHYNTTLAQMRACMATGNVVAGVICADGRLGYPQPVGGVIGYEGQVSVSGAGFDIACGTLALRLDTRYEEVAFRVPAILADIRKHVSLKVRRANAERVEHSVLDDDAAWAASGVGFYRQKAAAQFGTVGGRGHYVDLMTDEAGFVWIGIHFGSRGLGHTTTTHYINMAGGRSGAHAPPVLLPEASELGMRYLAAMELAGRYAYAGRDWVVERVRRIIGGAVTDSVHNHHNYCIAGDQVVPTRLGPKRMADVRPGDEVYAFDPRMGLVPTRVRDHWCSGTKPILRISTFNRSIRVSADHPIQVIPVETVPHPSRPWHNRRVGALAWKRAGEVATGDIIVCAEGYYETAAQPEREDEEDFARFVGAFLGDGWTRANPATQGHTVGLAIGGPGELHTADYLGLVAKLFPGPKWRSNKPGEFGLTVADKALHRVVTGLGIGANSRVRRVPPLVFDLSRDAKLALLAGYVDADGSVANSGTSNHGRAALAAVNRHLVEDLRELAISCGLRVTPVRRDDRMTNFGPCTVYCCTVSAASTAELPLWHRRKAGNQRRPAYGERQALQASKIGYLGLPARLFAQTVQSIEADGEEAVYDLSVDHPTHSFVCEGMVVHNCWRESHGGRDLWVVRKGATPAFPGQRGFIGGSMGDDAVIVEGVQGTRSAAALYSTVHGAGRLFSRTAAKRTFTRAAMDAWLKARSVTLAGGDLDESPMAYRRLPDVLAEHAGTIRVLHRLRPFAGAMAGPGEFDPFKD